MAISYMAICLFDFIIGPIQYQVVTAYFPHASFGAWKPLTLEGSGLFHVAMGAILGVSAWSRGQEKIQQQNPVTNGTT
jgi:hypothetical protein